jgi:hypothetical protein
VVYNKTMDTENVNKEYDNCGCPTCKEMNVSCVDCPVCNPEMDKKSPCWEGYAQRGMKPGKDGNPVPNCVPVKKQSFWGGSFDSRLPIRYN